MFQSTWGTPQQNQPSAFGQSSFGNAGNTSSVFGNNQQQPAHNPMFGNLSGAPAANNSNPFGGFGSNNNNNSVIKPAVGFGAGTGSTFGSTGFGTNSSTFGSNPTTSAFGSNPPAFGSNTAGTSAFGSTNTFGNPSSSGSAFGTGNTFGTGAFGKPATTTAFGQTTASTNTDAPVAPVTTGSQNPPYAPYTDKDQSGSITHFQAISAAPAYRGTSFEEIRFQDYNQGRKTATATTTAFGQPSTSAFNQPASQPFAAATTTSTPFGGSNAFGQTAAQPNAFSAQPTTTGTGIFGSTTNTFAQPQQQQNTSLGGAFGQSQGTQQPASVFGNSNAFKGFGTNTNSTGTSIFGQQQQQQQPQQQTSIFGQPSNTGGAFGGIGNPNNNAPKPSIFGQPAQPTQSIFGSSTQPAQTQTQPLFGGFGNNQQQQQQQQQQQSNPSTNTGGATGSIFGGPNLFGSTNQNSLSGNAFGLNKPPSTSAFGGGLGTQQSQTATTQQPSMFGGGIFGQTNNSLANKVPALGTTPSTGLFGGPAFGNSANTLNASVAVPGAQGTLTASISQPISANLPIFSLLPPGPRAVDLEQSTKKKTGFFVDVPTRNPVPRVALSYSPASSKLRGFSSPSPSLGTSSLFNSSGSNPLAVSRKSDNKTPMGSDPFASLNSSSLGSGQRKSVKKLVLDKKVDPSDLFIKSGGSPLKGGKITFSPALSIAAREDTAAAHKREAEPPAPAPRSRSSPNRFSASTVAEPEPSAVANLEEGDYYVKPDLSVLKSLSYDELSSFKDLVVGRVGYGEIQFLEPVDLTGLHKLSALLGEVIRFDDKECSVYPDSDDIDKPSVGSGLNVPARITLLRCWTVDKATREPVKDVSNPLAVRHLKKLKAIKDTHFENFEIDEGKWTFAVDHF